MSEEKIKGDVEAGVCEITDDDFLEGKPVMHIDTFGVDDIESLIELQISEIVKKNGNGITNTFCSKIVNNHIEIYPIKKLETFY